MQFRFSLEAVLRVRHNLERREHQKLQALLARRCDLAGEIKTLESVRLALLSNVRDAVANGGICGAELELATARTGGVRAARQRVQLQLQQLGSEIQIQTERYRRERQQREVLESLRDGQLRQYQSQQRRREQAALDELHLIRRTLTRQSLPR